MGWWILGLVAVALTAGIIYAIWVARTNGKIPEDTRVAIREAKRLRSEWRRARKQHARDVEQARLHLQNLQDVKGRRLGAAGGITLYERWISTPQSSGSLIGVKATAADESSVTVSQRLTATRMVTLGVFSLAAPKKTEKVHGSAYIVIEGPEVSGVGVIEATSYNSTPGPAAFSFAAQVNNAARAAAANAPLLPRLIAKAKQDFAAAENDPKVIDAEIAYTKAVAALPREYRQKFGDVRLDAAASAPPRQQVSDKQRRIVTLGKENAARMESVLSAVKAVTQSEAAREGWLGDVDFSADIQQIADSFEKAHSLHELAKTLSSLEKPSAEDHRILAEATTTAADLERAAIERVDLIKKCAIEAQQIDKSFQTDREDARVAEQRAELHAKLAAMLYGIEATPDPTPTSSAVDAVMARVQAYREIKSQIQQAREKTTKVRCAKCKHTQQVPISANTFQCTNCNAKLKRAKSS
ncbi:hypothetical protein [Mycobacterium bourgelatii]|uniref:Uncharacterized protein n=1 Tax=Mycobacterium bourgelatii TaxID=1273442 RepID=A0A7I9YYI3_MYCBU|nr:hypothetical protein [Mycobacterium bourgelatii]GFG93799.1 hypothetical protein MBOU_58410 [Mycobacterium bourgelatii]